MSEDGLSGMTSQPFISKTKQREKDSILSYLSRKENKVAESPLYFAYSTARVSRITVTLI